MKGEGMVVWYCTYYTVHTVHPGQCTGTASTVSIHTSSVATAEAYRNLPRLTDRLRLSSSGQHSSLILHSSILPFLPFLCHFSLPPPSPPSASWPHPHFQSPIAIPNSQFPLPNSHFPLLHSTPLLHCGRLLRSLHLSPLRRESMGLLVQGHGQCQSIVDEEHPLEYSEYCADKGYGWAGALPAPQGLYDPEREKDACGVGFAA